MKQKTLHKVVVNSAKIWGIKIEIYLTTEVPMGINIDQPGVQRNRYQMTLSTGILYSIVHTELVRSNGFLSSFSIVKHQVSMYLGSSHSFIHFIKGGMWNLGEYLIGCRVVNVNPPVGLEHQLSMDFRQQKY